MCKRVTENPCSLYHFFHLQGKKYGIDALLIISAVAFFILCYKHVGVLGRLSDSQAFVVGGGGVTLLLIAAVIWRCILHANPKKIEKVELQVSPGLSLGLSAAGPAVVDPTPFSHGKGEGFSFVGQDLGGRYSVSQMTAQIPSTF